MCIGMLDGEVEGFFVLGQNPAVGSANAELHRQALAQPRLARRARPGRDRDGDVLARRPRGRDRRAAHRGHRHRGLLPARRGAHREGRHVHEHPAAAAVAPQGGRAAGRLPLASCGSSTTSAAASASKLAESSDPRDRPVLDLTWDYPPRGPHDEPDAEAVLREINGREADGAAVAELQGARRTTARPPAAAGSTPASTPAASTRRRGASRGAEQNWIAPEWGWAWPANRRILYNRASADPDGTPWSERKRYVWWDAERGAVDGRRRRARLRARQGARTTCPPDGRDGDGRARAATSRSSCSPTAWAGCSRPPGSSTARCRRTTSRTSRRSTTRSTRSARTRRAQRVRPARQPVQPARRVADVFPFVLTTYRLTEHHTAGGMSRTCPYLAELQPEMFVRGLPGAGGASAGSSTAAGRRSSPRARRSRRGCWSPTGSSRSRSTGGAVHQVGLPYHWGRQRRSSRGDSANDLLPLVLDPNVHISEFKAPTCDIRPGRRPARAGAARARRGLPAGGRTAPDAMSAELRVRDVRPAGAGAGRLLHRHVVCIGCKACEVACKEWNHVPRDARLHRRLVRQHGALGADTWRHVAFVEQRKPLTRRGGTGLAGPACRAATDLAAEDGACAG